MNSELEFHECHRDHLYRISGPCGVAGDQMLHSKTNGLARKVKWFPIVLIGITLLFAIGYFFGNMIVSAMLGT